MGAPPPNPSPPESRRFSIRLPRPAYAFLAIVILIGAPPTTPAQEGIRPRLLDGATFWVGDPLKRKAAVVDVRITAIAFSPDGKRLIVGKENGLVQTIDVARHRMIASVKGHASEVNAIAFRPGQASYFTSGADERVREFGIPEEKSVDFRDQSLSRGSPMALSPNGKLIALGYHGEKSGAHDAVSFHDAASGKRLRSIRDEHGARSVAFSPDSRFLLCVGTWGDQIQLWDAEKAKLVWSRTEERASEGDAVDAPFLSGCAFGPTEHEYTVAIDNSWGEALVCIYDFKTGAVRKEFSSKQGHVKFVISPDAKTLAIGGYDATLELWDVKTRKRRRTFFGQQERIGCLAFSPDSRMVATGGDDGTVVVWDVSAGQ